MTDPSELRRRLEVQGFVHPEASLVPWLRFTPAVNLVVVAAGTALRSPGILLVAAVAMALGAALPRHPWDVLYDRVVRPLAGSGQLPASSGRRRLTFAVGAPWLVATAWCFLRGHQTTGAWLGGVMAVLIVPLATVHFCVVSEIVDRLAGARGRGTCAPPSSP